MWTDKEWLASIQHAYGALDPLAVVKDLTAQRALVARALAQFSTICDQLEKELAASPPPALELMMLNATLAELRAVHGDAAEAANSGARDRAAHFVARVRKQAVAGRALLVEDLQERVIAWVKRRSEAALAQAKVATQKQARPLREWAEDGERMTAAVVFTDIVDSTGSASRLGNITWNALTAKHFAHATRFAAEYDGCVVKGTGDGQLLVFRAAANALAFLLGVVREPGAENLRLKGGIHVGPILVRDGDIAGTAINMASRVASCAQEGEIWISDRARADVLEEGDPDHAHLKLVEHAEVRLKGIEEGQRLWSLAVTERAAKRAASPTPATAWSPVVEEAGRIQSVQLREMLVVRARAAAGGEIAAAVICAAGFYDALRIHWTRNFRHARGSDAGRVEGFLPARHNRAAAMCFPKSPSLWQEPVFAEDKHGAAAVSSMGFSLEDLQAIREMTDIVESMATASPDETIEVDEGRAARAMLAVTRGIRRLEEESPTIVKEFAAACVSGGGTQP